MISEEAWELLREKNEIKLKIKSSDDLSIKTMYREVHKQKAREVKVSLAEINEDFIILKWKKLRM